MRKCKLLKSKKSQVIIVSMMVAIMVFILVVMLSPVLREEIDRATNTTQLNISNPNISTANKATAIVIDMGLFYFIGILVAASISFVTGRRGFAQTISAIMVFVIVTVIITPLKDFIILARDSSHLFCTNTAITVGNRLACIVVDIWLFYFVITVISVGATLIFVTKVLPKQ